MPSPSIGITGADGVLGRALCEGLPQVRWYPFQGDIRDPGAVGAWLAGAGPLDAVFHLAAIVPTTAVEDAPDEAFRVNVGGTFAVLEAVRRAGWPTAPWICVVSSSHVYRSSDAPLREDSPLEPISLYGKTKCDAEKELLGSPNAITLRLATVFGMSARMRLDLLVNDFVYKAFTDGYIIIFEKDFKRNYVHIRDVAACFRHCIEHSEKMVGRPFNVGLDAANLSKEELALKVKEYVPNFFIHFSEVGSDPDKRNYIVSNQRLREAGFEAKRSLDEGIQELLKGYRMLGRAEFKNV